MVDVYVEKYDMKKSDGSIEFLEVSVPKVKGMWKLPNQVGSWKCYLSSNVCIFSY